jgi:hypothetical protein
MRRTGLGPGTEDERDIGQVRVAIDAVRALLPLVEQTAGPQAAPIRDALSQLQLAFVRLGGAAGPARPEPGAGEPRPGPAEGPGPAAPDPGAGAPDPGTGGPAGTPPPPPATEEGKPGEPGPAQRSGRLWIPGQ